MITAMYDNDKIYLPVGEIFGYLKVNRKIDLRAGTLRGFYLKQGNDYEIDFTAGTAEIGGTEIRFDTSQVIKGAADFYILPELMKKIFGLDFTVDFSSLNLILTTSQELPIVKDYRRKSEQRYMVTSAAATLSQAPLLYPRTRSLLNGGILDYSLSAYKSGNLTAYNYNLTGGAELLGGEAEGTFLGNISREKSQLYSSNLMWKYVFDSTRLITSAGLGNMYSNGLTQYGFRGVQVSNQPVAPRVLYGEYQVDAKTNPGWDIELYLNGQMIDYAKADASGNAHFMIPLVYGTSYLQLKYYGPDGQYSETDRRIQIPFTFVPSGEVDYTISAGKLNNTNDNIVSGNAAVGLTSWMTDKVGMDYVDSPFDSRPMLYNSLSLRLSPEYMFSFDAAPSVMYRSSFNALYASQIAFDLAFNRYSQNNLYNPGQKLQEGSADFYVPFSIGGTGLNVRAAGTAQQYVNGERAYSYSGYLSANVSQLNASFGYTGSFLNYGNGGGLQNYSLTASLLYSLFFQPGALDFVNGSLISATARYGVLKNSIDDIRFEFSKSVLHYFRVDVSAERDYVNRLTYVGVQIVADLPFTRSTSTAQVQAGQSWYTENLQGAIGFDSNYGRFMFNDFGWVGHSAATMRMFVDSNGNGKYDPGETVIKNGVVTLRQAASTDRSQDGIIREWNLMPYTRYSADVDMSSISNPLWIPRMKSFSFVTEPNCYKEIDIPFFVGGVVDGTVLRSAGKSGVPIPGLSLIIKSMDSNLVKTVPVFNDGSFYYMGLPPGKYEAYVDSSQLSELDLHSDPVALRFEVKRTDKGDFIDGLKITLHGGAAEAEKKVVENPVTPAAGHSQEKVLPKRVGGYAVQIGAFSSRRRAFDLASEAKRRTGKEIVVSYDNRSELYVVRSGEFDEKSAAMNVLGEFINRFDYSDAFVVSQAEQENGYLFVVQLAAFRSVNDAERYADEILSRNGLESLIEYKRSTGFYSVMIGPYDIKSKCEEVADSLAKIPEFRNAFVTVYGLKKPAETFAVLLGNFSDRSAAFRFAEEFHRRTGINTLVEFDQRTLGFQVISRSYATFEEATAKLREIRTLAGRPDFSVIVLPR